MDTPSPGSVFEEQSTTISSNETTNTTRPPWEPPYTTAWVVVSTFLIVVMMLFGTVANALTIAVIRRSSKLRTKFYTFILSLCVSDLISALISPLFLYRRTWGFDYFALPDFFCKFYWGMDYWTSFATALHILSLALLRFIGIQWPLAFRRINGKHIIIWIAAIWTIAFGCGLVPQVIFNEVSVVDRYSNQARWASCSLFASKRWLKTWQSYILFGYPVFLGAPAALVIIIAIAITVKLTMHRKPGDEGRTKSTESSKRMKKRRKKDGQIVMQLMLIVGSFLLGYTPVAAFHWYTDFTIDESDPVTNKFDWQFAMVQYFLLRFSECLNPVFYNLASRKMRKETTKLVKDCLCRSEPGTPRKRTTATTAVRNSSATSSSV